MYGFTFKQPVKRHDMKTLIIFDLDGTLAESKAAIDAEMGTLLSALFRVVKVAVISGGTLTQFQTQFLAHLPAGAELDKLSLLPTCGTRFFQYTEAWQELYSENLRVAQKQKIITALNAAVASSGFQAEQTWGDVIEDRESQITYSALDGASVTDVTEDPLRDVMSKIC